MLDGSHNLQSHGLIEVIEKFVKGIIIWRTLDNPKEFGRIIEGEFKQISLEEIGDY